MRSASKWVSHLKVPRHYIVTVVLVHVASFDTRRASLSPERAPNIGRHGACLAREAQLDVSLYCVIVRYARTRCRTEVHEHGHGAWWAWWAWAWGPAAFDRPLVAVAVAFSPSP